MEINGILISIIITICILSLSPSIKIHAYIITDNSNGTPSCSTKKDCEYNEICHTEVINNEERKYCIRDCRFPHPYTMKCVDPLAGFLDVCKTSNDCEWDKVCVEGKCTKACQFQSCGPNAHCKSLAHEPKCYCYYGYQGDPYVGCTK